MFRLKENNNSKNKEEVQDFVPYGSREICCRFVRLLQGAFPRFLIIRLSRLYMSTGRRTDKGLWQQNTSRKGFISQSDD
ncbi:hypothetical protein TNIN_293841 [Trichonephila inaurata madagascariensis]|uniref:Uncharacterized protein n=1 Tax=Trichonephila inaurata madagascariensis TaxID=2747483 RepID=A0A8X6XFZ4_9ARAC|nr:hypothetical protein TNIN_293841 [Trichonephila inaurata madagascariensis]